MIIQLLTAVYLKTMMFWDVTPCSVVNMCHHFEGTCWNNIKTEAAYSFETYVDYLLVYIKLQFSIFFVLVGSRLHQKVRQPRL